MLEIPRDEKDMYYVRELECTEIKKKRQRYMVSHDEVCKKAFWVLRDIREKHLKILWNTWNLKALFQGAMPCQ